LIASLSSGEELTVFERNNFGYNNVVKSVTINKLDSDSLSYANVIYLNQRLVF